MLKRAARAGGGPDVAAILLLSLGHLVVDLYQGAVPALLPVWKGAFGLAYAATGAMVLALHVTSSVIQPAFGLVSDRVRSRYLLPGALAAGAVGMAAAAVAPSYAAALAAIVLCGLGVALFHPEASYRVHQKSGALRATAMSWFSVGGNVGLGLGPLAVALLLGGGLAGMSAALGGVGLAVALLCLASGARLESGPARAGRGTRSAGLAHGSGERAGGDRVPWGAMALLGAVVVLRSWVHTGIQALLPLSLTAAGMGVAQAQRLIALFLLAGAAGTLVGGPTADSLGRKPVLVGSMTLMVPLLWWLGRAEGAWLAPLLLASGFVLISTFSVSVVMAQELMPGHVGTASGIILGLGVGTGGIGVTLLGWIADRWGLAAALHALVLLPLVGLALASVLPEGARPALRRHLPAAARR